MAVSIGDSISLALSRTGLVLFQPFRLGKWLVLAFVAALSLVGVGWPPAFNIIINLVSSVLQDVSRDDALDWYQRHQAAVIVAMLAAVVVMFPIYLLCRWVSSRGILVFYDALVTNEVRVAVPWRYQREIGNSLMKMWITWDLLWFNLLLLVLAASAALAIPDMRDFFGTGEYTATGWTVAAVVCGGAGLLVTGALLWVARSFIFLLVVPVMYIRQVKARPAVGLVWREIFLPHKGTCLLYFLTHIVIAIIKGTWAGIGFLVLCAVTLCMAYVVLFLPFAGNYPLAIASLPVMTFEGAFQLYFVSQFGSAYQLSWTVPVQGGFPVIMDAQPLPPAG